MRKRDAAVAHLPDARGRLVKRERSPGLLVEDDGAAIEDAALRTMAATASQEVTYTAVPPGSGFRMGINRDLDTVLDLPDNCPGVANDDQLDTDSDGLGDVCDPTPVPEPTQTLMLAAGIVCLLGPRRRRQRNC